MSYSEQEHGEILCHEAKIEAELSELDKIHVICQFHRFIAEQVNALYNC